MAQYEFIGALMGVALRTQQPLTLDLTNLIWKRLLNHAVDQADLEVSETHSACKSACRRRT
jgi:hypothetical protein